MILRDALSGQEENGFSFNGTPFSPEQYALISSHALLTFINKHYQYTGVRIISLVVISPSIIH